MIGLSVHDIGIFLAGVTVTLAALAITLLGLVALTRPRGGAGEDHLDDYPGG